MADRTWIGTTSGDFNVAGNWVEGIVPVNADNLLFYLGARNLDTNVDQSAKTFGNVSFRSGYGGIAGVSTATPFLFGCTNLHIEGGSTGLYLGTGAATIVNVRNLGAGPDFSRPVYLAGTITKLNHERGPLYVPSGTITTMVAQAVQGSCELTTPTVTTLINKAGFLGMASAGTITTLQSVGGFARIDAGTLTNCNVYSPNATVEWNTATTLAALKVYGGLFDASKSSIARTITASELWSGGIIDIANGFDNITLTAALVQNGGTFRRLTHTAADAIPV